MLCIVPSEMSERRVLEGFETLTSSGSSLLKGSKVEIDLKDRKFSPSLLAKIWKNFIEPSGCVITRWIAEDDNSRASLDRMGFKTSSEEEIAEPQERPKPRAEESEPLKSLIFFGNLRGGQKISHNGDVTVIGNVHRGAEVYASGNVTVIGRISGLVHAGCDGSDDMAIITRSLEAGQVRIGARLGLIENDSPYWGHAVTIRLEEDEVRVDYWPDL